MRADIVILRIWKKIFLNRKKYLILVFQFALGLFLLNSFLCAKVQIDKHYHSLIESSQDKEAYITANYNDENFFQYKNFNIIEWSQKNPSMNEYDRLPFQAETLRSLQENNPEVKLELRCKKTILYFGNSDTTDYVVNFSSQYKTVKVSRNFLTMVHSMNTMNTINTRDFPFTIEDNQLLTLDQKKYTMEIVEDDVYEIWLPMETYYSQYHPKDLMDFILVVSWDESTNMNATLNEIFHQLKLENRDMFSYQLNSDFTDFLSSVHIAKEEANIFLFFGMILMSIILIGLSGLFMLLVIKRKKEIAICVALGGTKVLLFLEIAVEMLSISLLGTILGIGLSQILLLNGFNFATIQITSNLSVALQLIWVPFLVVAIAIVPVYLYLKKMLPIQILRTL